MTNTDNTTPRPEVTRSQILSRYENLRFEMVLPDRSNPNNRKRGARRSNRKTRTIL